MDSHLRKLEREISANGYQHSDVENFLHRAMRAQSQDDLKKLISSCIEIYNSRLPSHHLALSTIASSDNRIVTTSFNLMGAPFNLNFQTFHRLDFANHGDDNKSTNITINLCHNDQIGLVSTFLVDLGPYAMFSYPIGAPRVITPDATLQIVATPPCDIAVLAYGERR